MKKILLISMILCFTKLAMPQQDVRQYNYYVFDDYYMNPAYVGNNNHYAVNLAYDTRFSGMGAASPRSMIFSAHSRLGEGYLLEKDGKINKFFSKFGNTALGFQMLNYNFGPQYEYNFGLTYGYHLRLSPNVKTKLPRKMVLAFTPRLLLTGFDRNKMTNNDGIIIDNGFDNLIPPLNETMMKANFMLDVGAIYQNTFANFGFTVLNLTNTKNGFEDGNILYGDKVSIVDNDTTVLSSGYSIYDSIYSPRLVFDLKLKFLSITEQTNFEINFIPKTAIMYAPRSQSMEVFLDMAVNWNFYESITSIRRQMKYQLITGLHINHKRNFKPYTLLQPYVAIDFLNYSIMYAYNFNPNVEIPGYFGGNQISLTFNISRDKTDRQLGGNNTWK